MDHILVNHYTSICAIHETEEWSVTRVNSVANTEELAGIAH